MVLDVESKDVARQYEKVLQIFFTDGQQELFSMDKEPAIREAYLSYRTNKSTGDKRITAEALNGEHLQFLCSDILTLGETTTDSPEFSLMYPAGLRMFEWEGKLFYEAREADILGVLWLK